MKKSKVFVSLMCSIIGVILLSGCGGSAPDVTISLESGDYMGEQVVELTNNGGGPIYYTLDGSDPTKESILYDAEKGVTLNFDAVLKARTISDGKEGKIAEAQYKVKEFEAQSLTAPERGFLANVTGTYKSGETTITFNYDKTVDWSNLNGTNGSSTINIAVPEDSEGYQGTIIYNDTEGKEAKFEIDCLPQGDNAIFINGVSYDYQG